MKKNLLKSILIFLMLPVIMFVGCKNKETQLPKINLSRYFKDEISVLRYGISEKSTDTISLLTQKKAKKSNLSKYQKFELNANSVWIYKMYIESISFYVYCNESSDYQMTINVTMSDLADEEGILNSTDTNVETETVEQQCSLFPKAKKAIKCNVKINKTVVNALGSTITIDILNSPELFSSDGENESTFMWLIYGFEIHGESRTYSR